jgi:hypothetical protein
MFMIFGCLVESLQEIKPLQNLLRLGIKSNIIAHIPPLSGQTNLQALQ